MNAVKCCDAFCDHCADGFLLENDAAEAIWLAFRDRVDAQQAAELTRIKDLGRIWVGSADQRISGSGAVLGVSRLVLFSALATPI